MECRIILASDAGVKSQKGGPVKRRVASPDKGLGGLTCRIGGCQCSPKPSIFSA
jgi:hypothetical protein